MTSMMSRSVLESVTTGSHSEKMKKSVRGSLRRYELWFECYIASVARYSRLSC